MKVYRVIQTCDDDNWEHNYYESPLFVTRELAEAFAKRVKSSWEMDGNTMEVIEVKIYENYDIEKINPAEWYHCVYNY